MVTMEPPPALTAKDSSMRHSTRDTASELSVSANSHDSQLDCCTAYALEARHDGYARLHNSCLSEDYNDLRVMRGYKYLTIPRCIWIQIKQHHQQQQQHPITTADSLLQTSLHPH